MRFRGNCKLHAHRAVRSNLRRLGLSVTEVSDDGLRHLTRLVKLRNVSLLHARVTDEGVQKLKEALPGLDVYYRWPRNAERQE